MGLEPSRGRDIDVSTASRVSVSWDGSHGQVEVLIHGEVVFQSTGADTVTVETDDADTIGVRVTPRIASESTIQNSPRFSIPYRDDGVEFELVGGRAVPVRDIVLTTASQYVWVWFDNIPAGVWYENGLSRDPEVWSRLPAELGSPDVPTFQEFEDVTSMRLVASSPVGVSEVVLVLKPQEMTRSVAGSIDIRVALREPGVHVLNYPSVNPTVELYRGFGYRLEGFYNDQFEATGSVYVTDADGTRWPVQQEGRGVILTVPQTRDELFVGIEGSVGRARLELVDSQGIELSMLGSSGPRGIQGIQGPSGPSGPHGPTGPQGGFGGIAFDMTFGPGHVYFETLDAPPTTVQEVTRVRIPLRDDGGADLVPWASLLGSRSQILGHVVGARRETTRFVLFQIGG